MNKYFKDFFIIFGIFLISLTGCDIGLGSQVDVGTPSAEITYPDPESIIRGTFVIKGTCSDDMGVTKVSVTLGQPDTSTGKTVTVGSAQSAVIASDGAGNKEGSWSITVDPTSFCDATLTDGSYIATVVASDNSGHASSTLSLAFSIDNHAPVFIISSPSSETIDSPTSYGRKLKVAGSLADDHTIKQMNIGIFGSDGVQIGDTVKFTNVEPSSVSSGKVIAQYSEKAAAYIADNSNANPGDEMVTLCKNYLAIYTGSQTGTIDTTNLTTKNYYCVIQFVDDAAQYTGSESDSTEGNATTYYYSNDKIYDTLLSTNGYSLSADDIKKILNGNYSGDLTTDEVEAVKTELANAVIGLASIPTSIDTTDESLTISAFSLNPDAAPRYDIIGCSYTGVDALLQKSSDATISYTATAGRDNVAVEPWTFVVNLYKLNDDGTYDATTPTITMPNSANYAESKGSTTSYTGSFTIGSYTDASGTKQTYSVSAGDRYVIEITGEDQEGEDLYAEDSYGFKVASSGNPPTIKFGATSGTKNKEALSYYNDASVDSADDDRLLFGGTVATETNSIGSVVAKLTITNNDTDAEFASISSACTLSAGSVSGSYVVYTWNCDIGSMIETSTLTTAQKTSLQSGNYLYTLDVTGADGNGSASIERQIFIDTVAPVLSFDSITPVVDDTYVNGIITINGSLDETNPDTLYYTVLSGDGDSPVTVYQLSGETYTSEFLLGNGKSWTKAASFDTTASWYQADATASGGYRTFTCADGETLKIVVYAKDKAGNKVSAPLSYVLKQSTDRPRFETQNFTNSVALNAVSADTNLFDTSTAGSVMTAQISDDDSIAMITYSVYTYTGSDSTVSANYTSMVSANSATLYPNKTPYTLSVQLPSTEGKYRVVITVTDTKKETTYGDAAILADTFVAVDTGVPTITLNKSSGAFVTTNPDLTITATDSAGIAKLERYNLTYDSSSQTYSQNDTIEATVYSGTNTATVTADTFTITSGTIGTSTTLVATNTITTNVTGYKRYIVYDAYGRKNSVDFGWKVDMNEPSFTVNTAGGSTYASSSDARIFYQNGTYQITGTVTDVESAEGAADCSQIAGMYYKVSVATPATTNGYYSEAKTTANNWRQATLSRATAGSSNGDTATWTLYVEGTDLTENTTYTVYFAAVDNAGYVSLLADNTESATIKLIPDKTAPAFGTADVYGVSVNGTETASGASTSYQKGSIAVTGALTELHLDSFSVTTTKGGTKQSAYCLTSANGTASAYTFTVPTISESGNWAFTVTAKDKAGLSTVWTGSAMIDNDAPTITLSNLSAGMKIFETSTGYTTANSKSYYTVSGECADSASGLSKLYYANTATMPAITTVTDTGMLAAGWTAVSNVNSDNSFSQAIEITESTTLISFAAVDAVGNVNAVSRAVVVDLSIPVITLGAYSATNNSSSAIAYTLYAYDAKKINKITVDAANSVGTISATDYTVADTETATTNYIYKTITINTGNLHDGNWTFTIDATDAAGRSATTKTISVEVDSTKPTLVVTNDFTDATYLTTSNKYYTISTNNGYYKKISSSPYYVLSGTWSDNVSGTYKLYYSTLSGASSSTSIGTTPTTSWVLVSGTSATTTSTSWTVNVPMPEGTGKAISVMAVDALGNETVTNCAKNIICDYTAPVLSAITLSATKSKTDVTVSGTVTESYLSGFTVTATKNGSAATSPKTFTSSEISALSTGSAAAWSFTLPAANNDGVWILTLTATDASGQESSASSSSVQIDTTAPTISTINISSNQSIYETNSSLNTSGNTFTLTGTMTDLDSSNVAGVGATTLYYRWGTSGSYSSATFNAITNGTCTVNIPVTEGTGKTLSVYAADSLGNASSATTYTGINIDYAIPVINVTTTPASTVRLGGTIQVAGTITDSDGVATASPYGVTVTLAKGSTTHTVSSATYASKSFDVSYTAAAGDDGEWTLTVASVDVAGREAASKTYTVTVDATAPTITYTSTTSYALKTVPQTFNGTMSDATAVSSVYYLIQTDSTAPETGATGWKSASIDTPSSSGSAGEWSTTINMNSTSYSTDTKYYIFFKAKDTVGNEAIASGYATLTLDGAAPTISSMAYTLGGSTLSGTTVYSTGLGKSFVATATVTDSLSMGSVDNVTATAKLGSTTYSATTSNINLTIAKVLSTDAKTVTVTFTIAIPSTGSTDDGTWTFSVSGGDAAGNTATTTTGALLIDTVAPVVKVTNIPEPSNSVRAIYGDSGSYKSYVDTTNDTYSLRGTWSDVSGSGTSALMYSWDDSTYSTFSGTASVTASKTFIVDLPITQGVGKTLYLKATDEAGNTSAVTSFADITIDYAVPTSTFLTSSVSTYYNYNTAAATITIPVADTNGIASVAVVATLGGTTTSSGSNGYTFTTDTFTSYPTSGNATITLDRTGTADGTWTFATTVTDRAGRTTTLDSFSTIVDGTLPVVVAYNDSSKPFQVNSTNWSASTWYKVTTAAIDGYFDEQTSGLAKVYYWIQTPTRKTSGTSVPSSLAASSNHDGYVTLANTASSTAAYSMTIGGFEVDASSKYNELYIQAEDAAGNLSALASYIIHVDQVDPTFASAYYSFDSGATDFEATGTVLTNGKTAIDIYGTIGDTASGVGGITFTIGGTDVSSYTSVTYTTDTTLSTFTDYTDAEWKTYAAITDKKTITGWKANILSGGIASGSVKATPKDTAGNGSAQQIFTFAIDNTSPTVTLSSPNTVSGAIVRVVGGSKSETDAASGTETAINGSVEFSGTAKDNYTLNTVALYYSTDDETASISTSGKTNTLVSTKSGSDAYSWTFTQQVSSGATMLNGATYSDTAQTAYFKIVATDSAVNQSVYVYTYSVDPSTDRPTIKISDISESGGILKYGTKAQINGTITDDDSTSSAIVTSFVVSGTPYTSSSDTASGTTTFDAATGSWTYEPASTADGTKTVYFYITDNQGGEFYTAAISSLEQPYLQFKSSAAVDNSSSITYKSDSNSPEVTGMQIATSADNSTFTSYANFSASTIIGGTSSRYIQFQLTGTDANGIAGMELTVTNSTTSTTIRSIATDETFSATSDSSTATWTTDAIDLYGLTSGSITVTVKLFDTSALYSNLTSTFALDNTGPTISITSPASTDEVTGAVSVVGIATDSSGSTTDTTQWAIPTTAQVSANTTDALKAANFTWTGTLTSNKTASAWEFDFDNNKNPLLTDYDTSTYYTLYTNGIYILPFYIKSTDALGNYTIYAYSLAHNPDADKPKTTITYPTDGDYDEDAAYVTLGGTIRVTGTSIIPSGTTSVAAVYIQIADSAGSFTSTDSTTASSTYGYTVKSYSDAGISSGWTSTTESGIAAEQSAWWGIAVTKTSSTWYINLNEDGGMNPTTEGETNNVAIRACAVNADGKVGSWSDTYYVHIDDTAPSSTVSLCQFSASDITTALASSSPDLSALTPTATDTYDASKYLKGTWYLKVILEDESDISTTMTVKEGSTALTLNTGYYRSDYKDTSSSPTKNGYILYIPIDENVSSVTYNITAMDMDTGTSGAHTIYPSYTLYIDNTAPTINTISGNNTAMVSGTTVTIADSSYVWTMKGSVSDTGSGFTHMLFYYLRSASNVLATANTCVLDPMISNSKSYLSTLDTSTITQGDDTFTVYGKTVSGSQTSTTTFTPTTAADVTGNIHIRVGNLIYIGGVYRLITAIDSSTGVITLGSETGDRTNKTAFFPYGQVVDNTSAESVSDFSGYPFAIENDDGDGMPESVVNASSTWTWSGTTHSTYLPDGPVTIVFLAFDSAGNVAQQTYTATVANNAPRLAKLYLGTDLDGSATYTSDELVQYDVLTKKGVVQSAVSVATADYSEDGVFVVKDKLAVIPEFTGGNSTIKMAYKYGATDTTPVTSAAATAFITAAANATATSTTTTVNSSPFSSVALETVSGNSLWAYEVPSANLGSDATGVGMSFTFWDSTDETTCGTNSEYCVLYASDITVDQVDEVAPHTAITPFYWTSATDNSLYENSTANGHIDLEADWKQGGAYVSSATSGVTDGDPKVSGKIKIEGYCYDDQRITGIYAYIKDFTFKDSSSAALATTTVTDANSAGYAMVKLATYSGGTWSYTDSATTLASQGWKFSVSNSYLNQTGHKVVWELDWNSANANGAIATADEYIRIASMDKNNNVSLATPVTTTGITTYNNPYYKVDVVPYISTLSRSGNSLRSRLGKLQAVVSDTITMTGFNLPSSSTSSNGVYRFSTANKAASATSSASTTITTSPTIVTANTSITFTAPAYSGYIGVATNGVLSLNNGNYAATYNYESADETEGSTDTSLDQYYDDRYLSVWQTGTTVSNRFIANGEDPVGPAIAANGTTVYGGWGSGASYVYTRSLGSTTNVGYISDMRDPPSQFDVAMSGATPYFVVLDNWQSSTSNWSKYGLSVWSGTSNSGGSSYSGSIATNCIEVQGDTDSAASPDHTDGMDEVQNQFLNPRITMSGSTAYVSYYDRYSKCLKWAYYTGGSAYGTGDAPTNGYYVVDGWDNYESSITAYGDNVGKYSDIVVNSSGYPIIAYSDETNNVLKVAYPSGSGSGSMYLPKNTSGYAMKSSTTNPTSANAWSYITVTGTDSSGTALQLGKYTSLAIDGSNNLHIATQDSRNGDLYYVYIPCSSGTTYGTPVITKIDSTNSVGKWTDIKLTTSSSTGLSAGPVISYLDSTNVETLKAVKVAYYDTTNSVWETMTVPAVSSAVDERTTLVVEAVDGDSVTSKLGIGYKSNYLDTAFLRGE